MPPAPALHGKNLGLHHFSAVKRGLADTLRERLLRERKPDAALRNAIVKAEKEKEQKRKTAKSAKGEPARERKVARR